MDWRTEWYEFEDVAYLNLAGQAPMPRVSIRAAQEAIEWKKFPHRTPEDAYFGVPDKIRASIARLIGGAAHEVAVTTGASGGLAAVARGFDWKPEDEVLIARGEFPAHFATWKPLEDAGRLTIQMIEPRGRFIAAEDFLERIGRRTRVVSVSLVRFDDGSLLDPPRVSAACHSVGAILVLDVSQAAGAIPLDVKHLGADFAVCAGYKYLLSPFGTGFFWAREDRIEEMKPMPFYWMALESASNFSQLGKSDWKPVRGARRWDAAETSSFFNLAAMHVSLEFVLRAGAEAVAAHCRKLLAQMIERLPLDRCVLASPAEENARGAYACFAARTPEKTAGLYEKLRGAGVITSLREGAIRVAPHLYNTEQDIDRLVMAISI
jgi:cysteine desulfurase/selenocysteine lyase